MYFNARSLRNKIEKLRIAVQTLNPDIICIVETWLSEEIFDSEIYLEKYNFIRIDRINNQKDRGGGVLVYIKENLSFVNCTDEYCFNIDCIWVKIRSKKLLCHSRGFL